MPNISPRRFGTHGWCILQFICCVDICNPHLRLLIVHIFGFLIPCDKCKFNFLAKIDMSSFSLNSSLSKMCLYNNDLSSIPIAMKQSVSFDIACDQDRTFNPYRENFHSHVSIYQFWWSIKSFISLVLETDDATRIGLCKSFMVAVLKLTKSRFPNSLFCNAVYDFQSMVSEDASYTKDMLRMICQMYESHLIEYVTAKEPHEDNEHDIAHRHFGTSCDVCVPVPDV